LIVKKNKVKCKNCQLEINITEIPCIAGIFGINTDLRSDGFGLKTPRIIKCKRCFYIFCDKRLNVDKNLLDAYIKSGEYKNLLRYEEKKYLVIYNIYKNIGLSLKMQNKILLYNYYDTKKLDDLKLLANGYKLFLQEHTQKDKDFLFANMMIGEYYRRVGEFEKAKDIFTKLLDLDVSIEFDVVYKCRFQLKLIEDKYQKVYKFSKLDG
jgi:tetratricopeptide (TPR) repeat protein